MALKLKPLILPVDPSTLSGLKAWYKADALGLSNGSSVSSWIDSSGSGNTLNTSVGTQTFNASDPQFNNMPTVTFDNSGYLAKIGGVNITGGSAAITLYFVGIINDDKLSNIPYEVVSWGDNLTEGRVQFVCLPYVDTYHMEFCNTIVGNVTASVGTPIIATYTLPAGANVGAQPIHINGTAGPLSSLTVGGDYILNIVSSEIVIGACAGVRGTSAHWLGGKVAEVLIFNDYHDSITRRRVESYLANKYRIAASGITDGGFKLKHTGGVPIVELNPSSRSDLVAWYKADSLALSNGATVTNWPDDSLNNNDLNSYGGAPIYNNSDLLLGGMPSVTYDGSDWNYRSNPTGLPVGSSDHTTYVVGYWDGTAGGHAMFAWGSNSYVGCRLGIYYFAGGLLVESLNIGSKVRPISSNTPFVFSFPYTGGANYSASTTYLDGVGETGEYPGAPGVINIIDPVTEITIGYPPTAGGERWTGAVAEVLVFNTTHDEATRRRIEKYLANKYGISVTPAKVPGQLVNKTTPSPVVTPIPIDTTDLILYVDASNPVSYPGSGTTWYDLSGLGNDLSATGSPTYIVEYGGGFDVPSGTDGFSSGGALQNAHPNGLSVGAWVKSYQFASFLAEGIVERGDWSVANGWAMYVHFARDLHGPRYFAADGSLALSNNTIYYLTFTLSNTGTAKVFVNGVLDGTANSVTLPTAGGGSVYVGRSSSGGYSFSGKIYEAHIYDRGLSDAEVLSNFNATKSRYGL